jgi:ApaG protein
LTPARGTWQERTAVSSTLTRGIRVTVKSFYLAERSSPATGQYAFAYTVRIANEGGETAQLRSRHWIITDSDGKVQEVRGEGVVGAQPTLRPGQHFEYTSWCMLATPHGSMHGSYQMVTEGGDEFDATIAPFPLALPYSLN